MKTNKNYAEILRILNDGFEINDLTELDIKQSEVNDFLNFLKENNLTVENAKALNVYSEDSKMILGVKKGYKSKDDFSKEIYDEMIDSLNKRGLDSNLIDSTVSFVKKLNYKMPLYFNYEFAKDFLEEHQISKKYLPSIASGIKKINTLEHLPSIISEIDDVLNKSEIDYSTILYRALKLSEEQINSIKNEGVLNNLGYTSTSDDYRHSFAKYEDYKVVLEMNVEKGTKGISIAPFSDYGSVESEVLLAPNTFEINSFKEKDGKIIFNGNVVSKNLEKEKHSNLNFESF